METDHIKIHIGPHGSHPDSYVELNGQELKLVTDVEVRMGVGKVSEVKLTMLTQDLDIEGDVYAIKEAKEVVVKSLETTIHYPYKPTITIDGIEYEVVGYSHESTGTKLKLERYGRKAEDE